MPLRTRVTVIVCLALLALAAVLTYESGLRERFADERFARAMVAGQHAVWNAAVHERLHPLTAAVNSLAGSAPLSEAVAGGDERAIASSVRPVLDHLDTVGMPARIEVTARDGRPVYVSHRAVRREPALQTALSSRTVESGSFAHGVGYDARGELITAVALPLRDGAGYVVGAVTFAADLVDVLRELAADIGGEAVMVDSQNRTVFATAPELWSALAPSAGLDEAEAVRTVGHDDRFFTVVTTPIDGFDAPDLARLITVVDTTESHRRQQRATLFLFGGGAALVALTLAGLSWYLRRSFKPLDRAIATLNALSEGDTSVAIEGRPRDDEIGRIARTVEVFRGKTIALEGLRLAKERERRHQQDLIRRQLTELANTLDEAARAAVMDDLREIEAVTGGGDAPPSAVPVGPPDDDGQGVLAVTLQKLTARVTDQHRELTRLVAELRAALETKTAFVALQRELGIARDIQRALLPTSLPPRPEFSVCGRMIAAEEVGGDFYDFFYLDDHHLAVAIGDVSGKGVPAALFMAVARTVLRATAMLTRAAGPCVAKVNDLLVQNNEQQMFVTLFYGVLDIGARRFTYVNGGHNPPILVPAGGGTPVPLDLTGGLALGIMPGVVYRERTLALQEGDELFLYTDGVTEAMTSEGEQFSESRLIDRLSDLDGAAATVEDTADRIVDAVKRFEAGAAQTDDITCVVLRLERASARAAAAAAVIAANA